MNKSTIKQIRKDIDAALESVEEKHGITLELGNIRYSDFQFTTKLKATVVGDAGDEDLAKFKAALAKNPLQFEEIAEEDFGEEFEFHGETFKLVGLNPRAKKFPLIGEKISRSDNRRYKMPLAAYTRQTLSKWATA